VTLTREATRRSWGGAWRSQVADLTQDFRYAIRTLSRSPGYSFVVVAVLALGIGANVSVFSLFNALAIKPIPGVEGSAGLGVLVARTDAGRILPLSHRDFRDLREQGRAFAGFAGTSMDLASLLYGVSPTDAVSFTAAAAVVLTTVLVASFVPAWRASRTDPIAALRHR
jgi:ABC-type antimicrobial peptide transport system permease subunit